MKQLKALWQRLLSFIVRPYPWEYVAALVPTAAPSEDEEITSEWIVVAPKRKILM